MQKPTIGFLDLPGEIKNKIYRDIFHRKYVKLNTPSKGAHVYSVRGSQRLTPDELAFLRCAKQIHHEAAHILYDEVLVIVDLGKRNQSLACLSVVQRDAIHRVRHISLLTGAEMGHRNLKDLFSRLDNLSELEISLQHFGDFQRLLACLLSVSKSASAEQPNSLIVHIRFRYQHESTWDPAYSDLVLPIVTKVTQFSNVHSFSINPGLKRIFVHAPLTGPTTVQKYSKFITHNLRFVHIDMSESADRGIVNILSQ